MDAGENSNTTLKRRDTSTIWFWTLLIPCSAAAGSIATLLGVPAAWMVGPMLVSLLFSVLRTRVTRFPKLAFSCAQMVIGVLIAGTFNVKDMPLLLKHWYAVLMVSLGTLLISVLIGYVLAKRKVMDRPTAFLGVMPGGASGMVAMSAAMSADAKIVALMQYVRMFAVVISASFVTKWIAGPHLVTHPLASTVGGSVLHAGGVTWCISLLVGAIGAFLGVKFRVPAGAMLGAMALGLVVNMTGWMPVSVPTPLSAIAYAALGIYVGLLFDNASIRHAGKLLPTIVISTLALIVFSAAVGWLLSLLTPESFLTWFLATSPGGLDSITLMALGSGANVALVVSLQTVRLFAIVFLGPIVVRRVN